MDDTPDATPAELQNQIDDLKELLSRPGEEPTPRKRLLGTGGLVVAIVAAVIAFLALVVTIMIAAKAEISQHDKDAAVKWVSAEAKSKIEEDKVAALTEMETEHAEAVKAVDAARQSALEAIKEAAQTIGASGKAALAAIERERTQAIGALNAEKQSALPAIGAEGSSALGDIRLAKDDAIVEIQEQLLNLKVPIGSIIAWHPQLLGLPNDAKPPAGWVRCDGGKITGGDLDDANTPNLNDPDEPKFLGIESQGPDMGGGAFLRGGTKSGVHQHATQVPVLTEVGGGEVRVGNDIHMDVYMARSKLVKLYDQSDYNFLGETGRMGFKMGVDPEHAKTLPRAIAVRPENMSVVWIMRVK